jgi:hypothetical protein
VEPRRIFVDGVAQHRADTGLLGNQQCAADGILQQSDADPSALILQADGQTGKDHDGDRILSQALANALRRIERIDLADGQAEITSDAVVFADDEGLGRAAALRLSGMAHQPVIECRFAAIEAFEPVLCPERLCAAQAHALSQGAFRENRSRSPSFACSGCSSKSIRAWYWLPETMNKRWSSRVCSAAWQALSRMKSVSDLCATSAARRRTASCSGVARNPRRAERVAEDVEAAMVDLHALVQ